MAGNRGFTVPVFSRLTTSSLLTLLLFSCSSPGIETFEFIPVEGPISTASILDNSVVFTARYLDADERYAYFRNNGCETLGRGLGQVQMISFVLKVKNGSDRDLVLNPGGIRLAVGMGPLLSPYNYAHLYMELPKGSDRQKILADLRKAVFDKSTTISPGSEQEKLLLFARPEKVGPEAAIFFQRLYIKGKEFDVALDFRAVDLEK